MKPLKTIFFVPTVPTGRGSDCTKADVAVSITPAFGKIGNFDDVDKVAHRIARDIVLEQLEPREKLPNELSRCEQPGVSRSALRGAVCKFWSVRACWRGGHDWACVYKELDALGNGDQFATLAINPVAQQRPVPIHPAALNTNRHRLPRPFTWSMT